MQRSYINAYRRVECEGVEFNCGDVVEVFISGEWKRTRIEHSHHKGGYYSVDGYQLELNPIRPAKKL